MRYSWAKSTKGVWKKPQDLTGFIPETNKETKKMKLLN